MDENASPPGSFVRDDVPEDQSIEERVDLQGRSLRQQTVRGTLINSGFQVGLALLGFLRRFVLAAFLTREEFGIWGILITTLVTLTWLKELGVGDKYIQQNERDQEAAFQKAFTLELLLSAAFFLFLCVALPVYGVVYGHSEIILPGIVLAASVPISVFETPTLIAYRRMQFVRQRTLTSIDPVVALAVTIVLGALGAGYWALVIGVVAGSLAGGLVATLTSPYKLRLRFHKGTFKEYASFSTPLLGYQVTNLIVIQGIMIVGARALGVAALGAIALASSISALAERVDGIVSQTIYPAICAVADRRDLLHEAFEKSNRLAVMWGMTFGVGLALFASDLVHFVLGDRWVPAIGLLAAFGLIAGFRQIAWNWHIFMRAVNNTRPLFIVSLGNLASMALLTIPLMFAFGLTGYAIGMASALAIQIVQRYYFLGKLFRGFDVKAHLARAIAPSVPSAALVLGARLLAGGARSPARAVAELVLYLVATAFFTWVFEREFLRELGGYLRGRGGLRAKAQALPQTAPREPSRA
jgi:O-antigen/teichoic acid export membrane protein